jgi:hypothetical protein
MKHVPVTPYLVYLGAWSRAIQSLLSVWYGGTQTPRHPDTG